MQARHVLAFIILAAIWGASFLFARISAPEFGPILTAVIAHYCLKTQLTRKQLIGLVIGIFGVTILMSEKISWSTPNLLPLIAPIGACLCYAISANMTKKKLAHIPPKLIAASSMLMAGTLLMPFAIMNWPAQPP